MKLTKLSEAHDEAMEVLSNITQALYIVQNGPFTAETLDRISGPENAIESLMGRNVVLDTMTPEQTASFRLELAAKLRDQEFKLLSAMRKKIEEVSSDLESVMVQAADVKQKQDLMTTRFIHHVSDKGFVDASTYDHISGNCFSLSGGKEAVEALNVASEFLTKICPLLTRIYDEEQQSDIEHDAETTTVIEPPSPDENNGQGDGHQVYTPFHTEETEDAITEIIAACASNISLSAAAGRLTHGGFTLKNLGYASKTDVLQTIESFQQAKTNFIKAVNDTYEALPSPTDTLESFGHNSSSYYKAVEAVLGFINRADMVREGMDESISALVYMAN